MKRKERSRPRAVALIALVAAMLLVALALAGKARSQSEPPKGVVASPRVRPLGLRASTTLRSRIVHNLRCIHRYEGRWDDPGWPYWGGLQMDRSFMRAYGPSYYRRWGTADHWPVWAQLAAGVRAVRVRGYEPWPRTRHYCGV